MCFQAETTVRNVLGSLFIRNMKLTKTQKDLRYEQRKLKTT